MSKSHDKTDPFGLFDPTLRHGVGELWDPNTMTQWSHQRLLCSFIVLLGPRGSVVGVPDGLNSLGETFSRNPTVRKQRSHVK